LSYARLSHKSHWCSAANWASEIGRLRPPARSDMIAPVRLYAGHPTTILAPPPSLNCPRRSDPTRPRSNGSDEPPTQQRPPHSQSDHRERRRLAGEAGRDLGEGPVRLGDAGTALLDAAAGDTRDHG
jgi:hypothetical protein